MGGTLRKGALRNQIKAVFWDVDGTLFRKSGRIEERQKLLLYNAYANCRQAGRDQNPFNTSRSMAFKSLAEVPADLKREYDSLLRDKRANPRGKYGSNGHLFMGEFGKDQCYVAKIISTIDYSEFLPRDPQLVWMFESFSAGFPHIRHGIMSNEVYETISRLLPVLGLDLSWFRMEGIDRMFPPNPELMRDSAVCGPMGVLSGYNLLGKKPDEVTFRQMLAAANLAHEPGSILYVGDSETKDIIPANALGITTALVWADEGAGSRAAFVLRTVYDVLGLFER